MFTQWLHRFAHLWGGWMSTASIDPGPYYRSQCGGPRCDRCCNPGRSRLTRTVPSSLPPWRGILASATWDCGPTTGPKVEAKEVVSRYGEGTADGFEGGKKREKIRDAVQRGRQRETARVEREGGWIRRLIFKHIHAWVIDVCSALDK